VEEDSQLPSPFCSDHRPTPSTSLSGGVITQKASGPNHPDRIQGGAFSDIAGWRVRRNLARHERPESNLARYFRYSAVVRRISF